MKKHYGSQPPFFVEKYIFMSYLILCSQAPAGMINSHSYSSRAYFFDNPRRYDSDDDLPRLGNSREGR